MFEKLKLVFIFLYFSAAVAAQTFFVIKGTVIDDHDKEPLIGAPVYLQQQKLFTETDENGKFIFKQVKAGPYTLVVSLTGHKTSTTTVLVPLTHDITITLKEDVINLKETVVTGNPFALQDQELSQSTISLSQLDLQIKRGSTLAQSLNFLPGVAIRSNGTATSRPVIRGFSNNLVLILEDGLRMGDLSAVSDDHGISDDGSEPEKVEILRGPASLLYGSNAIGGVVNIITDAIPSTIPQQLTGHFYTEGASVNGEFLSNLHLNYGYKQLSFHTNWFKRNAGDYKIPDGRTGNSYYNSYGGQSGISLHGDWGGSGLSIATFNNKYGIPAPPNEISATSIAMKKLQVKMLTQVNVNTSIFTELNVNGSFQKYQHKEINNATNVAGTAFSLETGSLNFSLRHNPFTIFSNGVFGVSSLYQNYSLEGSEAITPNTKSISTAFYLYEQAKFNNVLFSVGARLENNSLALEKALLTDTLFSSLDKSFTTFSGSLGLVYTLSDEQSLFINIAKAFRSPAAEELASYGVHEAANSFDIGDRKLSVENNTGVDAGIKIYKNDYSIEVTGYYDFLSNYIARIPQPLYYNDLINSNLPFGFNASSGFQVKKYQNNRAVFYGFEAKTTAKFDDYITVTMICDYVRARNTETQENLPQIPPFRFSLEPRYSADTYWFGFQLKAAAAQNFTAPTETRTAGYTLLDLYVGAKFFTGRFAHILSLKVENALNQPYRDHLSAIKEFTLMPGRNILLGYKFLF